MNRRDEKTNEGEIMKRIKAYFCILIVPAASMN
jgi:hypothetical protein